MKKILCVVLTLLAIAFVSKDVFAMDYEDAFALCDKKPMVMFLYADWSSYKGPQAVFRKLKDELSDKYNFVELNIASSETADFNSRYPIGSGLPYIMTIRANGKIVRYINGACASDAACIKGKLKTYTPTGH